MPMFHCFCVFSNSQMNRLAMQFNAVRESYSVVYNVFHKHEHKCAKTHQIPISALAVRPHTQRADKKQLDQVEENRCIRVLLFACVTWNPIARDCAFSFAILYIKCVYLGTRVCGACLYACARVCGVRCVAG